MLFLGTTIIFVYTELIQYQNTSDLDAPFLRIIDNGKSVENFVVVTTQGLQ